MREEDQRVLKENVSCKARVTWVDACRKAGRDRNERGLTEEKGDKREHVVVVSEDKQAEMRSRNGKWMEKHIRFQAECASWEDA
jgi:hypothetical protein